MNPYPRIWQTYPPGPLSPNPSLSPPGPAIAIRSAPSQNPPQNVIIGTSFIGILFFFAIAFGSNAILKSAVYKTLGITITLSTLLFIATLLFILFAL